MIYPDYNILQPTSIFWFNPEAWKILVGFSSRQWQNHDADHANGQSFWNPTWGHLPFSKGPYMAYPLVHVYISMENHNFLWEYSLVLWPFSIAILP